MRHTWFSCVLLAVVACGSPPPASPPPAGTCLTDGDCRGHACVSGQCEAVLPAPANVRVSVPAFGQIRIEWDAVATATAYSVYRGTAASLELEAQVSTTSILINPHWTTELITVAAVNDYGAGPKSAVQQLPPVPAAFWVTASASTAQLWWDAPVRCSVFRARVGDAAGLQLLVTDAARGWTDTSLADDSEYDYAIEAPGVPRSASVRIHTSVAPPTGLQVTAFPVIPRFEALTGITVAWDAVPGAAEYRVSASSVSDPGANLGGATTTETSATVLVPPGKRIQLVASASGKDGWGRASDPVDVFTPPAQVSAVPAVVGAYVTWVSHAPVRLLRSADGSSWHEIARVSQAESYLDLDAPAWAPAWYTAVATDENGESPPSHPSNLMVPGPPDSQLLGAGADGDLLAYGVGARLRVVPTVGGRLWGVVVLAMAQATLGPHVLTVTAKAGGRRLGSASQGMEYYMAPPLSAERIFGDYVDFSDADVEVSAGTPLDLELSVDRPGTYWLDVSAADGGLFSSENEPLGAHDLPHQVWIQPLSELSPPSDVAWHPAAGSVQLDWLASPAATEYAVYVETADAPRHLLANTRELSYVDDKSPTGSKRTYWIAARRTGEEATSDPLVVLPPNIVEDQLNAGTRYHWSWFFLFLPQCPLIIGDVPHVQTFTVGTTGTLRAIQLAATVNPAATPADFDPHQLAPLTLHVLDSQGREVAASTRAYDDMPTCCELPSLGGPLLDGATFDLSSASLHVQAGDVYALTFTSAASYCANVTTDGSYSRGALDGNAAVDLAFRTFVTPDAP